MNTAINNRSAETANLTLTVLCALMVALFFCAMPRYVDDFWFSQYIYQKEKAGLPVTFHEVLETWRYHYGHDNARLANIVFVPFLLLPKWCGSLIAAAAWAYVLIYSPRIAGINIRNSALIPIFLTLCAFAMPWYDSIGAENYQFNYVIPTALSVAAIIIFLTPGIRGAARIAACLVFGCIAGSWHEGFGIPVAAATMLLYLLRHEYRTRSNTALIAGLTAGIIWIVAAPSFWRRLEKVSESGESLLGHTLFISMVHPAFLVMLALLLFIAFSRHRRKKFFDNAAILLIVSAFCSFAIHMFSTRPPRTGWWCEFASILLIVRELSVLLKEPWLRYTPRGIFAGVVLSILTLTHLAVVDYYSISIGRSFNDAIERHKNNPEAAVFADVITEHDSPLAACLMPDFTLFVAPTNLRFVNECLHADDNDNDLFIPIPQELSEIDATSGRPVEGGMNCRIYKERIFMPTDSTGYGEFPADIDFGFTKKSNVRMCYYTFVSPRDGKRYAYLYPWRRVIEMRLGEIRSISRPAAVCP